MDYFILAVVSDDEGAMIESLPAHSPADWRFGKGLSLANEFPADAALKFADSSPDRRELRDFMANVLGLLITSPRARSTIESLGIENAEFLSVKILDHKGRIVADDYAILNLLGSEEAIDMSRSRYSMNALNKTQIGFLDSLALSAGSIDAEAKMFRVRTMLRLFLIRDDVRLAFEQRGLTGYRTFPAEGWDGIDF